MNNNTLFLTLRVFSATGGIEKVCRVFAKAIADINTPVNNKLTVLSMYDSNTEVVSKYIPTHMFTGFEAQKIQFVYKALQQASQCGTIIISHINLLSIGYLIKLIYPQKKLFLFVHGIEVWHSISPLRKKMLRKCNAILSVSRFTKNRLQQQCNLPKEKLVVLNNCLDPFLPQPLVSKDKALQNKYGLSATDKVLLTLTRMSSKELYKGYDSVLLSIKSLKQKYPALKYLLVGRYDDAEKQRLDTLIKSYGLQQQVVFAGYVPDEQLAAHYSLADVFVMPSKKEGFGIVFIEAMYYGLPVIAGNKDGSVDALLNGQLGVLVNPDDQENINTAIDNMLMNKQAYLPNQHLLQQQFGYNEYKNKLQQVLFNTEKKEAGK